MMILKWPIHPQNFFSGDLCQITNWTVCPFCCGTNLLITISHIPFLGFHPFLNMALFWSSASSTIFIPVSLFPSWWSITSPRSGRLSMKNWHWLHPPRKSLLMLCPSPEVNDSAWLSTKHISLILKKHRWTCNSRAPHLKYRIHGKNNAQGFLKVPKHKYNC